eukprot:GHVU01173792.1.p1 GENE.GHVU01173792.1~~GHVU01173792.1.p1  ORF type:complete len:138 (-),score=2.78 GHVU01173792.1:22-435(-)
MISSMGDPTAPGSRITASIRGRLPPSIPSPNQTCTMSMPECTRNRKRIYKKRMRDSKISNNLWYIHGLEILTVLRRLSHYRRPKALEQIRKADAYARMYGMFLHMSMQFTHPRYHQLGVNGPFHTLQHAACMKNGNM